ncbi:MAG: hypothetical protein HC933_08630 [Pleurocapsa sp. SU_196_0]|nr:hypothetical protein [Pleurocapsa sp. SU_196_0]
MDTPNHRIPESGIAQKPTTSSDTNAKDQKEQFDETGAPLPTAGGLGAEQRDQIAEDQRHSRGEDLEYVQGGDTSDENGDPITARDSSGEGDSGDPSSLERAQTSGEKLGSRRKSPSSRA